MYPFCPCCAHVFAYNLFKSLESSKISLLDVIVNVKTTGTMPLWSSAHRRNIELLSFFQLSGLRRTRLSRCARGSYDIHYLRVLSFKFQGRPLDPNRHLSMAPAEKIQSSGTQPAGDKPRYATLLTFSRVANSTCQSQWCRDRNWYSVEKSWPEPRRWGQKRYVSLHYVYLSYK